MAKYTFFDVGTIGEVQVAPAIRTTLIPLIEKAEKKNFPTNEAFDFNTELRKRNSELLVYLDHGNVVAYAVFNRLGKLALLHKILVLEQYRRQGLASTMLKGQIERLKKQGCLNMQLWVDETREPAKRLYQSLGFEEIDCLKDYYSLGRTAIKLKLRLSL